MLRPTLLARYEKVLSFSGRSLLLVGAIVGLVGVEGYADRGDTRFHGDSGASRRTSANKRWTARRGPAGPPRIPKSTSVSDFGRACRATQSDDFGRRPQLADLVVILRHVSNSPWLSPLGQVGGGADKDALLRSVGLEPGAVVSASFMIKDTDYYPFFERAAAADTNARTLPLRVGASMRCDEYGPFGFAWKTATTLRGSFDRAERYALVLTSVTRYEVEKTFGGAFMRMHREGERRLGMRLSNEASLASVVSISRQVASEPFRAEEVDFRHAAPSSTAEHEAYFECPVHFGSDRDALLVSDRTLHTPNRLGDESIAMFFDTLLGAEVSKIDDTIPLERLVQDQIATSLSEGVPALSDVARRYAG